MGFRFEKKDLVLNNERVNTKKTKNFRLIQDILYFATAEPS